MTIVIGRIIDNDIYIESDSRITDFRLVQTNLLTGLLKTIILNPFLCLSFAGFVEYAEKALICIF